MEKLALPEVSDLNVVAYPNISARGTWPESFWEIPVQLPGQNKEKQSET